MSSENTGTGQLNNQKPITFLQLFDIADRVQIPILQRDYAQGRAEEQEIRALFLNALYDALHQDDVHPVQTLNLDFIYGSFEPEDNKVFSVLDGQQRLTTLFLLHWYLASKHQLLQEFRHKFVLADKYARFTYKTRPGSTEFFNALCCQPLAASDGSISDRIRNSQWFFLSWQQDPTVQACLLMLDAIEQRFANSSVGTWHKLINRDTPYISFQFLNLDTFALSDELYIKMNARGKPLSTFENFKAKLEQKFQTFTSEWPQYQLQWQPGESKQVDAYHYFVRKIDSDWTELFWPFRNLVVDDNTFDRELMNFIRLVIVFQHLATANAHEDDTKSHGNEQAQARLFGDKGTLQALSFAQYETLGCISQDFVIRLMNMLDVMTQDGHLTQGLKIYGSNPWYYEEQATFTKVLSDTASYGDKLRFYAFYSYLLQWPDSGKFEQWLRVIFNLTSNTIVNTAEEFSKGFYGISTLLQAGPDVLRSLTEDIRFSGFSGPQIVEEKIKAHLILKSPQWRTSLIKAEHTPFLRGQIGCLLHFSGILAYYRQHRHCDWQVEDEPEYHRRFSDYLEAITAVFDVMGNDSSSIDYLWERAVLSKGQYFTEKQGNRFNLLSSRDSRNNIPRDHSWRRLLRPGSEEIEQKQRYVQAVLDDPLFDVSELQGSLQKICDQALQNGQLTSWQSLLIAYPHIYDECKQGFVEINGSEFIVLSESQRNHYHSELYTLALASILRDEVELPSQMHRVEYKQVKSREERPHIAITGAHRSYYHCLLEVLKAQEGFELRFKITNMNEFPDELASILDSEGFTEKDSLPSHCVLHMDTPHNHLDDIKKKILHLCSKIKE